MRTSIRGRRKGSWRPELFRARLARKGMTAKELADRLGVSVSQVWHWRTGHRAPNQQDRERMKKILAVRRKKA